MSETITIDTIVKAMCGIDWDAVPAPLDATIASGRIALDDLLRRHAAEREQQLQADVETVRQFAPMDELDDTLEYVVETMATELMQFTSVELAAIIQETGGRTLARMRRAIAADLLKQRLG